MREIEMLRTTTAGLLLAALAIGCASRAGVLELEVDGVRRTFTEHVPANTTRPAPVLLVLHGGGRRTGHGGARMGRFTGLDAISDREGFIAVYPNSLAGNWNDSRLGTGATEVNDLAFFDALLDDLAVRHLIDPARVYSVGISNGGLMTQRLLCERSERVAAGVSIVATIPENLVAGCQPGRPVAVTFVPGTADPLVPYEGGMVARDRGLVLSAADALALWVEKNGCDPAPVETRLPDLDRSDGSTVMQRIFRGCDGGVEVRELRVEGGGAHLADAGAVPAQRDHRPGQPRSRSERDSLDLARAFPPPGGSVTAGPLAVSGTLFPKFRYTMLLGWRGAGFPQRMDGTSASTPRSLPMTPVGTRPASTSP